METFKLESRVVCGATKEEPQPFEPTMKPWEPTWNPACFWCKKDAPRGKCAAILPFGEDAVLVTA